MADPTIHMDVEDNASDDGFDPVAAFLKNLVGEEKPSTEKPLKKRQEANQETTEPDADPENDQETEEQTDEDSTEGIEDDADNDNSDADKPAKRAVADDDEVEITVDGVAHKASVKDLKRLYGQEAAFTRKSQELAAQRKATEDQASVYTAGLTKMRETAEARWKEFEAVDWFLARERMTPEAFQDLRVAAGKAQQELKFFDQELNQHAQRTAQVQHQQLVTQARECVKALTSETREDGSPNPLRIEGWNDALYNDIRSYAVTNFGAQQETIDRLVDPVAIRILHMAIQYDKAQKAAKTTSKPKPTVPAPKGAITSKRAVEDRGTSQTSKQKAAMANLRKTGSIDAGADAFLAMFSGDED